MTAKKIILIGCFILYGWGSLCLAQNPAADHLKSFDRVWKTVNETHFDPAFGGVDWDAAGDRYRVRIRTAKTIEAFIRITNQMLFELRLSHFLVASDTMLKTYMPAMFSQGSAGMAVRWMKNKAVITRIRPGSPAAKAGLKTGYEITAINGRNVNEIVRAADALPPYNDRNRRGCISNFIMGHISGPPHTVVSIGYVDENFLAGDAVIRRRSRGKGRIIDHAMPPVFIEFEAKRLPGDVGYIGFNHFSGPVDKKFVRALEALGDTRGLIIDLRGNPGGAFRIADVILQQLITRETTCYQFRLRDQTIEKRLRPSKYPYEKPVAVLMDVTSLSCSEHLAGCLQAIGRAAVIGDRSPGYLLGAKWMTLPNGLRFMHSFLQPVPADGRIVEGHGIAPDLEIGLDQNDLLKGRDRQMEAAIKYIDTHGIQGVNKDGKASEMKRKKEEVWIISR